jgi:DNA-binding transcriptional LysR family regulator
MGDSAMPARITTRSPATVPACFHGTSDEAKTGRAEVRFRGVLPIFWRLNSADQRDGSGRSPLKFVKNDSTTRRNPIVPVRASDRQYLSIRGAIPYTRFSMEMRHLRYFAAVADCLHFGRAAVQLRITQPSLSQQIRQLETELQTTLLQRTRRRVQLTESGRLFLEQARDILARADRAAVIARGASRGDIERLRIGIAYWMDVTRLVAVVRKLDHQQPEVRVEIRTMPVPLQVAALQEERLDIGLVRPPIAERSLNSEPLVTESFMVALPNRHRLATARRLSLSSLTNEPFILHPRDSVPQFYDLTLRMCREAGFTPHVRHEVDHPDLVLRLVAAGMGISLVPASAHKIRRPGVAYRPVLPSSPILEIAVAWRRDNGSPTVKAFIGLAKQVFAGSPH